MRAAEIKVEELFKSDNQLLVPLWQRRYAWQRPQWEELWKDLLRVDDAASHGEPLNHFIGSVVLHAQEGSGLPTEAHRYLVVDGQQRITTLTILICAIRDRIALAEEDDAARDRSRAVYTYRYLRNQNLAPDYQERLVLQEPDRAALAAIVSSEPAVGTGLVYEAYRFFSECLSHTSAERALALLTHISKRLSAVWVVLEVGDNAHRVFQTLNAGGRRLEQADLVRNYFFLLLGEKGEEFYSSHWKNLEVDVPARKVADYLAAWAITNGHLGSKGFLFSYFQRDLKSVETKIDLVWEYGRTLVDAARLYRFILNPGEMDGISHGTARSLAALADWGTEPAEGLLLYLLRSLTAGRINERQLGMACELILSYLARRFLAGFAPNRHRSLFVRVAHRLGDRADLNGDDMVQFLRALLSELEGENVWPSDSFLLERVGATPVYTASRSKWIFAVLERVNRSFFEFEHHAPETLDRTRYTVEHVLPQTLSNAWIADLHSWGVESPVELHETHVHVLGNLTLSAINSRMQNKPFLEKRAMLQDDTLKLNQKIALLHHWDAETISNRGHELIGSVIDSYVAPLSRREIEALGVFDPSRDPIIEDAEVLDSDDDADAFAEEN
jgi:Uncharacterized conserved protein